MYLQISPVSRRWCLRLGVVGVIVGSAITSFSFANAFGSTALAQVIADPTVGSAVSGTSGDVQTITGGTRQGGNLFHSFQQFSVPTNGTAFFDNATDIQNILTRVTSGSSSDIDGLIRANGTANLFLLNPNGIVFGQNARLNIGGSFIATTASSINFADGKQFSATPSTGAPLLTVSVPLGLQFGASPGEIVNRSQATDSNNVAVGLQLNAGKTLGLIGGNVSLDGGNLTAAGGRIELGGVAIPGVVGIISDISGFRFSFPTDIVLGNISLTNESLVDVAAGGSGDIAVNARNLEISGGSLLTAGIGENLGSTGVQAGNIDINTQDTVTIIGTGAPLSSGAFNNVQQGGTGNGGGITIKARSLSLIDDAGLTTTIFGQGNAGNIDVQARDSVSLDNSNLISNLGSRRGTTPATGNVGNIQIKARTISFNNGAQLQAGFYPNARQQGNSGVVSLEATDSISFAGRNSNNRRSGIFTDVESGAVANGSNIKISAPSVSFSDAFLNASSTGQGNAGNIDVQARDSVSLNNSRLTSNLGSEGGTTPATGNVGNVQIKARAISLADGAQLQAGFYSNARQQGNSGVVSLEATDSISFAGRNSNNRRSGIFTDVESGAVANGSNIKISAPSVSFSDAFLNASSTGQGNAGNIDLQARDSVSFDNSFLTSNLGSRQETTPAIGNIGNIRIKARTIAFNNGAELQAGFLPNARQQGNPGVVSLEATDSISFAGRSSGDFNDGSGIFTDVEPGAIANGSNIQISTPLISLNDIAVLEASNSGQGDGGNIELKASKSVLLRNGSRISTSAGGTGQRGNAGNITITSPLVIANFQANNDIFANAFDGKGGEIRINAQSIFGLKPRTSEEIQPELQRRFGTDTPTTQQLQEFLSGLVDNDVAAISLSDPSLSGTISFNAADIDPSRDVVELPTGLVDASTLVASGCPSGAENRFTVAGRGGLPPAPGDKLSPDALLTDWATLQTPETTNRATVETTAPVATHTIPTPPVETITEASSWQYDRSGAIILTSSDTTSTNYLKATPTSCPSS